MRPRPHPVDPIKKEANWPPYPVAYYPAPIARRSRDGRHAILKLAKTASSKGAVIISDCGRDLLAPPLYVEGGNLSDVGAPGSRVAQPPLVPVGVNVVRTGRFVKIKAFAIIIPETGAVMKMNTRIRSS